MATTITPATLTVRITESILLGGVDLGGETTLSIASIANLDRRIVTALTTTNGTELLTMGAAAGAGAFIGANVKYIRITNLDATNYVTLMVAGAADYAQVKLEAGKSFILGANQLDNASDIDSTSLADITTIQALANTASVQLEVCVAST